MIRNARMGSLFVAAKRQTRGISFEDVLARQGSRIPAWETEYRFDPVRRWRFDFAWPLFKIAMEIEGGAHGRLIEIGVGVERRASVNVPIAAGTRIRVGGRHQTGAGLEADIEKYNRAAIAGWLLIRATTAQIRSGYALEILRHAFTARGLE